MLCQYANHQQAYIGVHPLYQGEETFLIMWDREKCHEMFHQEECDNEQQPLRAGMQKTSQASGTKSIPIH